MHRPMSSISRLYTLQTVSVDNTAPQEWGARGFMAKPKVCSWSDQLLTQDIIFGRPAEFANAPGKLMAPLYVVTMKYHRLNDLSLRLIICH